MEITIREENSTSAIERFVKFPFELFNDNPYWIPPIIQAEIDNLSPEKNPAFEHSDVVFYTAWENGKTVGRILGIINHLELDFTHEKHARFGWMDFVDNLEVCRKLIEAVEKWAQKKGMKLLKGPYGFNQLDKNGWLTEGFNSLGTANTYYNYEYYPRYIQSLGYTPDLEWLEIEMTMPERTHERFLKFTEVAKKRYHLTTRQPKNRKEMVELGHVLFDLLMDTYQNLPGFVPISKKQQEVYIQRYIKFLRRDFVVVVYDKDDQPVAFGVTLPSMTKAYKRANGKLFPFGLFHIFAARQWNDTADLALIGVREDWRKKGAHSLVFAESSNAVIAAGIRRIQINPMLENNSHVLSLWKDFDHRVYKRRKTFRKLLDK